MVRLSACALAVGLTAASFAVGAGSSTSRATLNVSGTDPISVRGQHFRARESVRVRIDYAKGVRKARTVRTSRSGTFAVSFDLDAAFDPCVGSLVATAIGSRGDSAQAKLPQRACPPPA